MITCSEGRHELAFGEKEGMVQLNSGQFLFNDICLFQGNFSCFLDFTLVGWAESLINEEEAYASRIGRKVIESNF